MEHSFDIDIAKEYSIECAILLKNIYYWTEKNRANNKHFHDGYYWTYNSVKAFNELFPYISEKKIRTALKKLESNGFLVTGNYNKIAYDRTTWYAVTDEGKSLLFKSQNHLPKRKMVVDEKENGSFQNVEPIPNINTDIKPVRNTYNMCFEEFWKNYPRKKEKSRAYKCYQARLNDGYSEEELLTACKNYARECEKEKTEQRYIKHGSTFLSDSMPFLDYLKMERELTYAEANNIDTLDDIWPD